MSSHSSDNPGFVTRAECNQTSTDVKTELKTIREALVGPDMQGGLVQKVSSLQNAVADIEKNNKNKSSLFRDVLKNFVAPIVVAVVVAAILTWPW